MSLRPIAGAPIDAPVPDFPTGEPGPLIVPAPRFTRRPVDAMPFSLPPPAPSLPPPAPAPSQARRAGPVEIRGGGDSTLIFRVIPEIPALNRSSMTMSVTGESTANYLPQMRPHLELAMEQAKAFLLALRDGDSPIVVAGSGNSFQVEFAIAVDGPTFTISKPGQEHSSRRFNAGWSFNVKTMAAHLLADLGP